jgi:hypothetical protein
MLVLQSLELRSCGQDERRGRQCVDLRELPNLVERLYGDRGVTAHSCVRVDELRLHPDERLRETQIALQRTR